MTLFETGSLLLTFPSGSRGGTYGFDTDRTAGRSSSPHARGVAKPSLAVLHARDDQFLIKLDSRHEVPPLVRGTITLLLALGSALLLKLLLASFKALRRPSALRRCSGTSRPR